MRGAIVPALQALQVARPRPGDSAADIGAGTGAVGLCCAILYPEVEVDLIDSRTNVVTFLKLAVARLGLSNARPVEARFEDLPHSDPGYDLIWARALTSDPGAPPELVALGKPSAKVIVWKATREGTMWTCWPGVHGLGIHAASGPMDLTPVWRRL
jgi:16S rRNA G527 N7-methylase RsmG